jgi:predicted nucleic acid-binding protein
MVYSEFAVGMPSKDAVDEAVSRFAIERMQSEDAVLWRAAAAYAKYRAEKGARTTVLPDFHVGALAEAENAPLMTNDTRDWQKFFPALQLIQP